MSKFWDTLGDIGKGILGGITGGGGRGDTIVNIPENPYFGGGVGFQSGFSPKAILIAIVTVVISIVIAIIATRPRKKRR